MNKFSPVKYAVEYVCENCGRVFKKHFTFGVKASEFADCPTCGCTAVKRWPKPHGRFGEHSTAGKWVSGQ